jgi:hypothetical protein
MNGMFGVEAMARAFGSVLGLRFAGSILFSTRIRYVSVRIVGFPNIWRSTTWESYSGFGKDPKSPTTSNECLNDNNTSGISRRLVPYNVSPDISYYGNAKKNGVIVSILLGEPLVARPAKYEHFVSALEPHLDPVVIHV